MATITTHAERILAAQEPEWLEEAAGDIENTMRTRWRLTVEPSYSFQSRGAGGWCDGTSITRSGIVMYKPTGGRRDRFTLAHELGHKFVDEDDECLIWLADREDVDRDLEQVCDVIASRILVPPWRLDAVLDGGPPTAQALRRLHDASEASWTCCAIALAGRLPCDGFVSIIDRRHQTVFYSARTGDTRPYAWAGDALPPAHALRRDEIPAKCKSFWPAFNKNEPRSYYLSADTDGDYAHAVFANNDLWNVETLHVGPQPLPSDRGRSERERYEGDVSCPSCGYVGTTALFPCSTCKTATCQRCGKCDCDRKNEMMRVMCTGKDCFSYVLPHLIEDGLCPGCR